MSLRELYGTAHYLDRDGSDGPYYITEDPKLTALVTREQERIESEDSEAIEEKLAEVVRDDVWGGSNVYVMGRDEIPDDSGFSVVVSLDYGAKADVRERVEEFFDGRTYKNSVQVVVPSKAIRSDAEIRGKVARVVGAENLRGKVEDENDELSRLIRDERRELRQELESRFGEWIKWTQRDGKLRMRQISVDPTVDALRTEIGRDKTYIGEEILNTLRDGEHG
ncbi:MAG: DUF499 domain-containing protein, partial [Halobaculum sp.]